MEEKGSRRRGNQLKPIFTEGTTVDTQNDTVGKLALYLSRLAVFTLFGALLLTALALTNSESGAAAAVVNKEIQTSLDDALALGYMKEDVDRFLSIYARDAKIVNYVYGKIDLDTLREKTIEDFARLDTTKATVEIIETETLDDSVIVLVRFKVQGIFDGDSRANRSDKYYLEMRETGKGWKIIRQSYRRDFGVTEMYPHLGQ